ncbi:MAG TPA: trypsin-like peptidase domain-containing protein, partial [Isosphaeraceae bacterium]|nr:trypsin-like peptidase domain-containing protein [Isosphaeraceae bacterium]
MRGSVVATVLLFDLATLAHGQVIEKQVLEQVKDATVYITVKAGRLQGSGSGFVIRVTGNTVLVMTNRHVAVPRVGALPPESKVEVSAVFRSGTAQQKELPARVLAFDDGETRDLAVLEVRGITAPPRPILADQSAAESDFFETMPVYALGFPLGGRIQAVVDNRGANPAITVTSMSISSLRRDEANRLARVQLNGPLIEGNSGGPVVDAKGRLVGVAVSRVVSESVGFAIPPSVIAAFLGGDIGGLTAEVLAPQGGNAQVKISLRPVDPLGKLQGVAIRYDRLGSSPVPEHHPDAQGRWPLIPGGTSVPLTLGNGRAAGQFSLPAVDPDDRKLIVQFVLTDTAGRITASKPMPVVIPERPGPIAGLGEAPWSQAVARWSCEVNLDGGCKMTHQPGFSTLDLPGGTPMVIAPQNKLYNAPSALVRVDGDFAAAVRVTNDFDPGVEVVALANGRKLPFTYQGAGLLIWQDEKNFVRFERCKGSDGRLGLISRVLIKVYKGGARGRYLLHPGPPRAPDRAGGDPQGGQPPAPLRHRARSSARLQGAGDRLQPGGLRGHLGREPLEAPVPGDVRGLHTAGARRQGGRGQAGRDDPADRVGRDPTGRRDLGL